MSTDTNPDAPFGATAEQVESVADAPLLATDQVADFDESERLAVATSDARADFVTRAIAEQTKDLATLRAVHERGGVADESHLENIEHVDNRPVEADVEDEGDESE